MGNAVLQPCTVRRHKTCENEASWSPEPLIRQSTPLENLVDFRGHLHLRQKFAHEGERLVNEYFNGCHPNTVGCKVQSTIDGHFKLASAPNDPSSDTLRTFSDISDAQVFLEDSNE